MERTTIGLIAAMPEEIRPLLRLAGPAAREVTGGLTTYRFSFGGRDLLLAESGMGPERAARAAALLIDRASPAVLVNFGFGGAVTADAGVGDIVVASRLLLHRERLFSEQPGLSPELADRLAGAIAANRSELAGRVRLGTFITTAGIVDKRTIGLLLPDGVATPVLEMESAAVAGVAARKGVPLVALRAISDGAGEELGFAITDFTDGEMRIRPAKVLWCVARKPWIIPQLVRLAGNTRVAGRNLAQAVMVAVENL